MFPSRGAAEELHSSAANEDSCGRFLVKQIADAQSVYLLTETFAQAVTPLFSV